MGKEFLITLLICNVAVVAFAQNKKISAINQFADITATAGTSQGAVSASYVHNWKLWKKQKWEAGLGIRWTSYSGTKKDFTTAPAKLSRSTTVPFAIVFAGQETQNWDTLTVQRPFTNSINISGNIGYNFSSHWYGGVNIDLAGVTFGRKTSGILISNGATITESVTKPTTFNLLLTGDNDLGSLNSEFFLKYRVDKRWSLKAVYQFLFIEYKTTSILQKAPDGTEVSRFRNKVNAFGLGASYNF